MSDVSPPAEALASTGELIHFDASSGDELEADEGAATGADEGAGAAGTDALLDRWVDAKRARDFAKADQLREDLRSRGVEPDKARPSMTAQFKEQARVRPPPPQWHGGPNAALPSYGAPPPLPVEAKLDQWVAAKRAKDFATADHLREELRAAGIDAEKARPAHALGGAPPFTPQYMAPPPPLPPPPSDTERKLDQWVAAKRGKDFATADHLREELRARGIDAEKARPAHGAPPPGAGMLAPPPPRMHPQAAIPARPPVQAAAAPPPYGGGMGGAPYARLPTPVPDTERKLD
eukprot:2437923-Prymnesium_polylepis.1